MAGNIEQKFDFQLGHLLCDIRKSLTFTGFSIFTRKIKNYNPFLASQNYHDQINFYERSIFVQVCNPPSVCVKGIIADKSLKFPKEFFHFQLQKKL